MSLDVTANGPGYLGRRKNKILLLWLPFPCFSLRSCVSSKMSVAWTQFYSHLRVQSLCSFPGLQTIKYSRTTDLIWRKVTPWLPKSSCSSPFCPVIQLLCHPSRLENSWTLVWREWWVVCFVFLKQFFFVQSWLSWNPLCRLSWPRAQIICLPVSWMLKLKTCATTPECF